MSSAAPLPLRAPLQPSQSGISRLISRPTTPSDLNGRRPLTAPNSPRLGGAGSLSGGGVRRKSASGGRSRDADPSIALQKALSSDEFLRKREGKKRGADGAGSENTQVLRNASTTSSSTVAMSRSRSSSSATSSTASGSTLQPRHVTPHPRASRSHSSLSRQRSRSCSRTSRGSPVLGASPLPFLPPTNRSVSSSSCPEPRGATLSVTPTTSEPVMVDVQAEGELELRGRAGGNAAEVLVELRDGRSVPNSEYGDDDRDGEVSYGAPLIPVMAPADPILSFVAIRRRSPSSTRPSSTTAPFLSPSPTFLRPTISPTRILSLPCTARLSRNRTLAVQAPLAIAPRPPPLLRPRRTPASSLATPAKTERVATATTAPCRPPLAPPAPSSFSPSRPLVSPPLLHPPPLVLAHLPPTRSNAVALSPPHRPSRSINAPPRNRLVLSSSRNAGGASRSSLSEWKPLLLSIFALLCIPTPRSRRRSESRRRGRLKEAPPRPNPKDGGVVREE